MDCHKDCQKDFQKSFQKGFQKDFQKEFQKDFHNFFLNPKVPSYQGPKVPRFHAPKLQCSKSFKPFYSSQNPLNLSFTLKQLLLAFIWKYHSVDFETIWMWGWVLSYVCILLMEFVSMFYL